MSKLKLLLLALSCAFVASADERMLVLHLDFNTIQMKKETVSDCLRTAAKAGYNAVLWEIENKVRWACCPECVHPEAFTKDEFRTLLAEAKRLGLRPIPLMQTFGHAEYVLMTGKHPDWIEDPSFPACYCVSNPEVVAFQKRLLHEYLELFGADVRDFHLGGDEALVFGTCPKCRQKPSFDFYAEHLKNIAGELESRGIRPGIWADRVIALTNRADVVKIPRHYTMWNWNYGFGADDRKPGREVKGAFLSELGYDVIFGCASQSVKDSVFLPQYGRHGDNIVASADLVRRKNLRGLCVTSWSVHLYPKSLQYPLWELAAKRLLNPADDPQADFASVVKARYGALDPQVLRTLSFWHNGLIGFDSRTWKGYMKPALPAEPGRLAEVLSGVDRWGAEARRQLRERNEKRYREIGAARAEIVRTARPGADTDRLVRASELAQEYLKAVDAALDGRPVTPPIERTAAFYSEEQPSVSATNAAAIAWSVLRQAADPETHSVPAKGKDNGVMAPTENVREPVNVDLGRQLFLNGRLVREMSARRVWHHPVKYAGNPVLKPETALEKGGKDGNAMSAPFSGGVWYDGREGLYKCFYHAGWANGEAYATSKDGIAWERPDLDGKGGNLAFRTASFGDSSAVILDPDAADGYRWKAFNFECGGKNAPRGGRVRVSKDGLSWSEPVQTAGVGDRTTVFYNPFTKKWGYSIRSGKAGYGRSRAYAEHADFIEGAKTMPDRRDWVLEAAGGREKNGEELYNFDCVAYESVLIGLAMVMNPPQNTYWSMKGVPKMTDLRFGFNADPTRWDGWQFPETKLEDGFFIPQTRQYGTWDMGYLQSNAAICLVIGDELRFYYSGFAGDVTKKNAFQSNTGSGMYANATMGFATLRRDGFCSIEDGTVRTKRLVFTKGDRLWLNVDAKRGAVKVSASDADGVRLGEATYASVDSTRLMSFALPADKPFELTFDVTGGAKLYSFWTSDAKGRSGGYLAGGSPESKTLRDVE